MSDCGICGEPLVHGQAALREVSMGDVHAGCLGTRVKGDEPGQPGELYQLDPEGVVDADDNPVPNSKGLLRAYAYEEDPQ